MLDLESTFLVEKGLTGTLPQNLHAWSNLEYLCVPELRCYTRRVVAVCAVVLLLHLQVLRLLTLPAFFFVVCGLLCQRITWELTVRRCAQFPRLPDRRILCTPHERGFERHTAVVDRLTHPDARCVS